MKPEERIVDVFLEEVVGGQSPPDLTEEILRRQKSGDSLAAETAESVNDHFVQTRSGDGHRGPLTRRHASKSTLPVRIFVGTLAGALLLCLTASIFYFAQKQSDQENNITKNVGKDQTNDSGIAKRSTLENHALDSQGNPTEQPLLADASDSPKSSTVPAIVDNPPENIQTDEQFVRAEQGPPLQSGEQPIPSGQLVSVIDQRMNMVWKRNGIQSATISDEQWCERVFVVLTGRTPTANEVTQFHATRSKHPRHALLTKFFGDTETDAPADDALLDEFANEWSRHLAGSFLNESIRAEDQRADRNPAIAHLLASLRYAVFNNTPYDHIAWELLTAKGSTNPLKNDYNGATGFLIRVTGDQSDASVAKTAARVGNGFLGQRMQCALCHDDNDTGLEQQNLHELAASLRDYKIVRTRAPGIYNREIPSQPLFYETTDGRLVAVSSPDVGDALSLRESLATKILLDKNFSRQAVNAVWSHVFGYGLVHPADGFGIKNSSVDRELLDQLSSQFVANGFDLRELLSWILMSEAFNRPAVVRDADRFVDRPEYNGEPLFARFYASERKPLSPSKALKLVAAAYQQRDKQSLSAKRAILANIAPAMPKRGSNTIVDTSNTLPIGATPWGVSDQYAATLVKIVDSELDRSQKIEHLFWLAHNREPTRQEHAACAKLFVDGIDDSQVYQDIWWAISKH